MSAIGAFDRSKIEDTHVNRCTIAGAMLVLGWQARGAALLLAVYTAIAGLIFHAYWSVPADQMLDQQIHFMKNVAITGGLLFVFAHGSARFSIER